MEITVYGQVQGVFFRSFTQRQAKKLGLTGYVRNLPGEGALEVVAEGERTHLEALVGMLEVGPPAAKVADVLTRWADYRGDYSDFRIMD